MFQTKTLTKVSQRTNQSDNQTTWPFDPYMTFDLTLLGTIYVQVPKDHLYQV